MPAAPFSTLSISPQQVANLESLGYKNMTPVQAKSLPDVGSEKQSAYDVAFTSIFYWCRLK